MPNISLPTGKVIYVSTYEFFFKLEDKDMDDFYRDCIADDIGTFIEDPFCSKAPKGKLEIEEISEIDEIENLREDEIE